MRRRIKIRNVEPALFAERLSGYTVSYSRTPKQPTLNTFNMITPVDWPTKVTNGSVKGIIPKNPLDSQYDIRYMTPVHCTLII